MRSKNRREFIIILGALGLRPDAARSQIGRTKIGVLFHAGTAAEEGPYFTAVSDGFRSLGYIAGQNISFEYRFPNEIPERFKASADELVAAKVDAIIAVGDRAAIYAKNATSTVPIIFVLVPDPIGSKLVASFARPGGNVTGVTTYAADLLGRRLQLLKEIMPGLSSVALLTNPNASIAERNVEVTRAAAAKLGLVIETFEARSLGELEKAFNAIAGASIRAVMLSPSEGLPMQGRDMIAKLALDRKLALCTFSREGFEPGALMSYGTDQVAVVRRAAVYVDKILKGANPADLPVEGPTKFEFLLNLKVARALGIMVPPDIPTIADEVID